MQSLNDSLATVPHEMPLLSSSRSHSQLAPPPYNPQDDKVLGAESLALQRQRITEQSQAARESGLTSNPDVPLESNSVVTSRPIAEPRVTFSNPITQ